MKIKTIATKVAVKIAGRLVNIQQANQDCEFAFENGFVKVLDKKLNRTKLIPLSNISEIEIEEEQVKETKKTDKK